MVIKATFFMSMFVLVSGCASKGWEVTAPEKRYQAMVNSEPNRAVANRRRGEWTNTFSILAPEGQWIFWQSTTLGHIAFTGGPEGIAGRYVGYELRLYMTKMNDEEDFLELDALITGDYDSYIYKAIKRTAGKHEKMQAGYSNGKGGRHPQIPDEFSMSMIQIKDMDCRLYEDKTHQYVWSQESGTKGPGAEAYSVGISCPGFFNGEMVSFSCGSTIRINNTHKLHGVEIDNKAVVEDLKRRVYRSLNSVQFNGNFTQIVPDSYRAATTLLHR